MTTELKQKLAAALNIKPEEIMTCREYADGYSIITMDFKKYTAVQPAELEPVIPAEAEHTIPAKAGIHVPDLPEDLQSIWNKIVVNGNNEALITKTTKKQLIALSKALDLPPRAGMTKHDLFREIEFYKSDEWIEPGTRGKINRPAGKGNKPVP